jgi:phage terminase large subunit-like protein
MSFDKKLANRAVNFISLLSHTGDFHGQPFELLPWERTIVWDVFGTLNARDIRLYRTAYLEIPKKNGKSELLSGIACYHLFNASEPHANIYGCAADRSQASIVYDTAVEMIMQEPYLRSLVDEGKVHIRDSYRLIENTLTGTTYKVLSAESFTKHGYRPSIVLFDELHAQPNRDLWDTMTKGAFLARRQPLLWVITTAGDDPDRVSIGWEVHEKAETILKARAGISPEKDIPTWYPVIYSYPGEDIYNESNWTQANPSLGHNLLVDDLRQIAAEARLSPADERTFRWLNLNQWITTKLTTWLPLDLFDATESTDWTRADLVGKDCFLGGDFSTTTDLSAICLVFPPQEGFDDWRVIWDCWIPQKSMTERIRADHVPYDTWAKDGYIFATEGDSIDYLHIKERILECKKLYKVIELPADMSFATMLLQELEQEGMKVVDVPQTYDVLTDPMNHLEVLLRQKRKIQQEDGTIIELPQLTHEPHPVARWCFGNTAIHKNGNSQIKYVKEHRGKSIDRSKRIDLTTAWVLSTTRAMLYKKIKSVYEKRGVRRVGEQKVEGNPE